MTDNVWGRRGDRQYQAGVDRGMVYPHAIEYGVPWNGLVSVSESTEGARTDPIYVDGQSVAFDVSPGRMKAVIDALHYPEEFGEHCLGESGVLGLSLVAHNQPRGLFDMTYRQRVGDDLDGPEANYKIVLIKGAIATDSEATYDTVAEDTDPVSFSWDVDTAVEIYDHDEFIEPDENLPFVERAALPTAKLVVDTRRVAPELVEAIEEILYDEHYPRFVELDDIKNIVTELTPEPVINEVTNPRGRPAGEIVEGDPEQAYENLVSHIREYTDKPIEWNTEAPDTSEVLYERADNLVENPRGRTPNGALVVVPEYRSPERKSIMETALDIWDNSLEIEWGPDQPSVQDKIWVHPTDGVAKTYDEGWVEVENLITNPRGRNTDGTVVVVPDYQMEQRMSGLDMAVAQHLWLNRAWSTTAPSDTSVAWINPDTGEVKVWNPDSVDFGQNLITNPVGPGFTDHEQWLTGPRYEISSHEGEPSLIAIVGGLNSGGGDDDIEGLNGAALIGPFVVPEGKWIAFGYNRISPIPAYGGNIVASFRNDQFVSLGNGSRDDQITYQSTGEPEIYVGISADSGLSFGVTIEFNQTIAAIADTEAEVLAMVSEYADGDTPGWQWEGTPQRSVSFRDEIVPRWETTDNSDVLAAVEDYLNFNPGSPDPDLEYVDGDLVAPRPTDWVAARGPVYYSQSRDMLAWRVGPGTTSTTPYVSLGRTVEGEVVTCIADVEVTKPSALATFKTAPSTTTVYEQVDDVGMIRDVTTATSNSTTIWGPRPRYTSNINDLVGETIYWRQYGGVTDAATEYRDGDFPNWEWDGTAHDSTSRRPEFAAGWYEIEDLDVQDATDEYQNYQEISPDPDLWLQGENLVGQRPLGWNTSYAAAYYSPSRDAIAIRRDDDNVSPYIYVPSLQAGGKDGYLEIVDTSDGQVVWVAAYGNSVGHGNHLRATSPGSTYRNQDMPSGTMMVRAHVSSGQTAYFRVAAKIGGRDVGYADGDSLGWVWDGEPHNSPSYRPLTYVPRNVTWVHPETGEAWEWTDAFDYAENPVPGASTSHRPPRPAGWYPIENQNIIDAGVVYSQAIDDFGAEGWVGPGVWWDPEYDAARVPMNSVVSFPVAAQSTNGTLVVYDVVTGEETHYNGHGTNTIPSSSSDRLVRVAMVDDEEYNDRQFDGDMDIDTQVYYRYLFDWNGEPHKSTTTMQRYFR